MQLHFETHNQCIDYLKEHFYEDNFIHNHTRKELAYILCIIEKHVTKQSPYPFQSMCKKRMYKHIAFYMDIHHIEPKQITLTYKERITKDLITKGLQQNLITIDKEDDLLAAYIGEYWFYICGDPDKKQEDFSQTQLINMIWLSINDEPINDDEDEYATECLYYKYFLEEHIQP